MTAMFAAPLTASMSRACSCLSRAQASTLVPLTSPIVPRCNAGAPGITVQAPEKRYIWRSHSTGASRESAMFTRVPQTRGRYGRYRLPRSLQRKQYRADRCRAGYAATCAVRGGEARRDQRLARGVSWRLHHHWRPHDVRGILACARSPDERRFEVIWQSLRCQLGHIPCNGCRLRPKRFRIRMFTASIGEL